MRLVPFAALIALASSVAAQDVGPALDPGLMVGWTGGEAVRYDNERRASGGRSSASKRRAAATAAGPFAASAVTPDAPFTYASTAQSREEARANYLTRLGKANPSAAQALTEQMQRQDFSRVYAGIVRPFGLAADDAADALAGYMVLGYLIATGAPDPKPLAVRAVRRQAAGRLGANPGFQSVEKRRRMGEDLKISFVTLHAGWQSARRAGNLQPYSDGVAALFQRNGIDLRQLRLTDAGFVAQ